MVAYVCGARQRAHASLRRENANVLCWSEVLLAVGSHDEPLASTTKPSKFVQVHVPSYTPTRDQSRTWWGISFGFESN